MTSLSRVRIVLANGSLVGYPQGGGLWTMFLQYLLGLRALGHDVFWLELFRSTGDRARDGRLLDVFFARFERHGFRDRCAVLTYEEDVSEPTLGSGPVYGMSGHRVEEVARSADLVWNFACALRGPLLGLFKRRVLVDGDPGHLQVSALTWDMAIHEHDAFLTAGTKLRDVDCAVPTLGVTWHPFVQFVYLPMWTSAPDPGPHAPFGSVTEWTWEELWCDDRVLSLSKRAAYLQYVDIPRRTGRPFELAANIHPADDTGDRDMLRRHGWRLIHPHRVARSPAAYRRYLTRCRAEFLCPKPIHSALRTGWFSDRSACYLASGRPVLMEDTGLGDHVPTGEGLLVFRDADGAAAGVAAIDADYPRHQRQARELAESVMDSRRCLEAMIAASGAADRGSRAA
jgi:hypothetical protein